MTINLGPFAVQTAHLMLAGAIILATLIGNWVGRASKTKVGATLLDMLLTALVVGRIVFVLVWYDSYSKAPLTMFDIRDGGFHLGAALTGAAALAIWRIKRNNLLRKPLATGLLAGAVAWFFAAPAILGMDEAKTVPQLAFSTLAGPTQDLHRLAQGRPMVVNLWATWCGPCRREMPVVADAERRSADIAFVLVSQGEERAAADTYLKREGLKFTNVLLDQPKALGKAVGSMALPTTLFYDANGKLVTRHVGALSAATMDARLAELRANRP